MSEPTHRLRWPVQWVGDDEVIISRAQYDALRAALNASAKALSLISDDDTAVETWEAIEQAVAALRAAGVSLS